VESNVTATQKAAAVGAGALLLVLAWQAATVHYNYGGNWSALFYIGDRWPLPPELASDGVRVFRNDPGYDAVFYHLVAHDPWLSRGFSRFADNASLRWRRILIPGLAYLAALGTDGRVHASYICVNLVFVFLGAWWLTRYCLSHNSRAACGLGFLAVPAVLVSMDRLTIDTALAALLIGLLVHADESRNWRSVALLALCPLARETGLCLNAGQALADFRNRSWKRAAAAIASTIPFFIWAGFVMHRTPIDGTSWLGWPFEGILRRTMHPLVYPITGKWVAAAATFDYLALLGIWVALLQAGYLALKGKSGPLESCTLTFALAAIFLGKADIWSGAYEFSRTMSPLLILLGLHAVREKNLLFVMPVMLSLPRILLQLEPQLRAMLRH
jgi:hypothetical protein